MNLALQKRHEQLERWRQNEAEAELIERQRQEELKHQERQRSSRSPIGSKSPLRSPIIQNISSSARALGSSNRSISSSSSSSSSSSGLIKSANRSIDSKEGGNEKLTSNVNKNKRPQSISGSHRLRSRQVSSPSSSFSETTSGKVKFTLSTLFLNACAQGDLDECRRMLADSQVDIDVTTCDGLTGLHEAAICGNAKLVEFLLDSGANINCCDHEGWTPLHAAASLGQMEIVELLLSRGADATIINCENFLALDLARTNEVSELIGARLKDYDIDQLRRQEELLIEKDIERWLRTGNYEDRSHPVTGATVLHVLAAKNYLELMKRILSSPQLRKQIDLEARDNEGYTPLLAASFWNQAEMVDLLIEHGADIFAQANCGYKISSIYLKNYQDSKIQQSYETSPQVSTTSTRPTRSSQSSLDSDNDTTTTASQSEFTRKSTASVDSVATSEAEIDSKSIGDNIPSGSARYLPSKQQLQLSKSKSLDITGSSQQQNSESPLLQGSMSVDRLLLRADSMGERDLRKSFKELVVENERLKQQLKGFDDRDKQRQQDWIRKERQLQRKISELEEENKQIELWRQEIQRLKDENSSLIRVVSKLTKQPH